MLSFSAPDSRRFGLSVWRGRSDSADWHAIGKAVLANACDVAIVRVPAGAHMAIRLLNHWCLPALHADTLVYYACDLSRHAPAPLRNADLVMRRATLADAGTLRAMVANTFANYTSHYHANPLFPPEEILAGYEEWATSHLRDGDLAVWLALRDGEAIAFAACRDHGGGTWEGVLYGVSADAAGGGVYGDLIRHTQREALARGASRMIVSTQVQNYAVQKVWAREGFHLYEALDTFHINALLSAGPQLAERSLRFSAAQIARFGEVSGDCNPLHVDVQAARQAGFRSTIAHGVMTLAELSRILGVEVPGPGTIITHLSAGFLGPVVADEPYTLSMHVPGGVVRNQPMDGVALIRDTHGRLCVVARFGLLLRD